MTATHDLRAPILRAIAANPDVAEHWHELADWLSVLARDDEAVSVRVLWPTLRDNLAVASLAVTLTAVAMNCKTLGAIARKLPRQADETPPV